jgi:beta-glucosidase
MVASLLAIGIVIAFGCSSADDSAESGAEGSLGTSQQALTNCSLTGNKVVNCTFAGGTTSWALRKNGGGDGSIAVVSGELKMTVLNAGSAKWHMQAVQVLGAVSAGSYQIRFDGRADAARSIEVNIGQEGGSYTSFCTEQIALTTTSQSFVVNCPSVPADGNVKIDFNGGANGTSSFYIDNAYFGPPVPDTSGCSNGVCEPGETQASCPADCTPVPACGNGSCQTGETCTSCAADCGACPPVAVCGNATCESGESCSTCSADCGACATGNDCPAPGPITDSPYVPSGLSLRLSDEFGGALGGGQLDCHVNKDLWAFENLAVNSEAQHYTTKEYPEYPSAWNYRVNDGKLTLRGRNEPGFDCSNNTGPSPCADNYNWSGGTGSANVVKNYTSGRINSKGKVQWKYGYAEARMRLPFALLASAQSGAWPAWWTLGSNINEGPKTRGASTLWPACGEVDIMEWASNGAGTMHSNVHYSNAAGSHASMGESNTTTPIFDRTAWNTYGFLWEGNEDLNGDTFKNRMTFYINGTQVAFFDISGTDKTEFHADQHFIFNLAFGGAMGGTISISDWTAAMLEIDYLRLYGKNSLDACTTGATPNGSCVSGDRCVQPYGTYRACLPTYRDKNALVADRVSDLIGRMSLAEKAGQMVQTQYDALGAGEVASYRLGSSFAGGDYQPTGHSACTGTRDCAYKWADYLDSLQDQALSTPLGIPFLPAADMIHGASKLRNATYLPQGIALAATRDAELIEALADLSRKEMLAAGVRWTYAPVLAVGRDPRWGRYYEGLGEHPEIGEMMAPAWVNGLQGAAMGAHSVLAGAKHWVADGGTGGGVDRGDSVMTEAALRAIHIPPYEAAIALANTQLGTLMPSFSLWNGTPMTKQAYLNNTVLKGEFGFKGFLVSDWAAVDRLNETPCQSCGGTLTSADVLDAVNAGIDVLMEPSATTWKATITHVQGVPAARMNDAVARILRKKFELGLFEKPYTDRSYVGAIRSPAHLDLARAAVRKSLVLLKNDSILPLSTSTSVCVAGAGADSLAAQNGGWTLGWQGIGTQTTAGTTIKGGIQQVATTVTTCGSATVPIVVLTESPAATYAEWLGDSANPSLDTTGMTECATKDCIVIMMTGRPVDMDAIANNTRVKAIIWAGYLGTEGKGVAEVLFNQNSYAFTGKLPFTWKTDATNTPVNYCKADKPDECLDTGAHYSNLASPPATVRFAYGYGLQGFGGGGTGCVPSCTGKVCGSDGCGGSCGACGAGQSCNASGQCVCVPSCTGKVCGSNGCGGSCGSCSSGQTCNAANQCVATCTPTTCAAAGAACGTLADGCGGTLSCGSCSSGQTCNASNQCTTSCTPSCTGKQCGSNGCGGSCGTCTGGTSCSTDSLCVAPTNMPGRIEAEAYFSASDSTPADNQGAACTGSAGFGVDMQATTDSGGGCNVGWTAAGEYLEFALSGATAGTFNITLRLAALATGQTVRVELDGAVVGTVEAPAAGWQVWADRTLSNVAISAGSHTLRVVFVTGNANFNYFEVNTATCTPNCTGKQCGADGCGGVCGACSGGQVCNAAQQCEAACTPNCTGKQCGGNGCGGSCGTCASGQACNTSNQCVAACVPSCAGKTCGSDGCGGSCGSCASGQSCNASNQCVSSGSTPCSGLCTNPVVFTAANYNSGNIGTSATCHETTVNLQSGGFGNFAAGRTFKVNDVLMSGGSLALPAKRNNGYCFQASAGDHAWAYFNTW